MLNRLKFRPMNKNDVGSVPVNCQGTELEIYSRIKKLGSAAILVFDETQHIAQLQFRLYDPQTRSPKGLWDPLYWGDFNPNAPNLRSGTLSIYCYHVGQLDETDARDIKYHGKGIGKAMLKHLLLWAKKYGFSGVAAKATPESRAVMGFMGGQPLSVYEHFGFKVLRSAIDYQLLNVVQEKGIVSKDSKPKDVASVSQCVIYF